VAKLVERDQPGGGNWIAQAYDVAIDFGAHANICDRALCFSGHGQRSKIPARGATILHPYGAQRVSRANVCNGSRTDLQRRCSGMSAIASGRQWGMSPVRAKESIQAALGLEDSLARPPRGLARCHLLRRSPNWTDRTSPPSRSLAR
jgi:hypothetical protein